MNFYLNFGIKEPKEMSELLNEIIDLLDVQYEMRDSDYFGTYYKCEGISFDKLHIYQNDAELFQYPEKYNLIIDLSITKGKNRDRKSKYTFVKKALAKIENLELFKDTMIED